MIDDLAKMKPMLLDQLESVVGYLFPTAEKKGREYLIGDVHGAAGDSLGIQVTGANRGLWHDRAAAEGGDIVDLWARSRGLTMRDTVAEIRQFLNIPDLRVVKPVKQYRKLNRKAPAPANKAGMDWIRGERKIQPHVLEAYQVFDLVWPADPKPDSMGWPRKGETVLAFPSYYDGELLSVKYRSVGEVEDPKKPDKRRKLMKREYETEPVCFGWQAIPEDTREIAITEGEIDALSVFQLTGVPAISMPNGAGSTEWIENDWDKLKQMECIYLVMDADDAGRKRRDEIALRLGRHRVMVVEPPADWGKDANAWLQEARDPRNVAALFANAKPVEHDTVVSIAAYKDQVRAYRARRETAGIPIPWAPKWSKTRVELRMRELVLVVGQSGGGKSTITQQLAIHAGHLGWRGMILSAEMEPEKYLSWMVDQASGGSCINGADEDAVMDWLAFNVGHVNRRLGNLKVEDVCEDIRYARQVLGTRVFIVDSLTKLAPVETDYATQAGAASKLKDLAMELDCCIVLVMHTKKYDAKDKKQEDEPEKYDARGSASITDIADTVLIFHRNLTKEKKAEDAGDEFEYELVMKSSFDASIRCVKQRETGSTGKFEMYFVPESRSYVSTRQEAPLDYVGVGPHRARA